MAESLDSAVDLALGGHPVVVDAATYEALMRVHSAIEILVRFYDGQATDYVTLSDAQDIDGAKTFKADITLDAAINLILDTVTGTKIGTAVGQKLGFWAKTPVVQPAAANQAALTNSTGGTYDGTISAVSGTPDDATINNNFTELHTLLHEIRTALVNTGLIKGSA